MESQGFYLFHCTAFHCTAVLQFSVNRVIIMEFPQSQCYAVRLFKTALGVVTQLKARVNSIILLASAFGISILMN